VYRYASRFSFCFYIAISSAIEHPLNGDNELLTVLSVCSMIVMFPSISVLLSSSAQVSMIIPPSSIVRRSSYCQPIIAANLAIVVIFYFFFLRLPLYTHQQMLMISFFSLFIFFLFFIFNSYCFLARSHTVAILKLIFACTHSYCLQ